MASPRTRPSSELVDDTIIDVLLRLPPEEPAHLVRASLVCKQWRRVLSHPDFLRLYARLHRTPPLLGLFTLRSSDSHPGRIPCFVSIPTTAAGAGSSSSSSSVAAAGAGPLVIDHCPWLVLDCRHGRVLLQRRYVANEYARDFLVWDPITGDRHELLWLNTASRTSAVVLCAAAADGCDHSGCRGGPFLVLCADVGIRTTAGWHARVRVYSSQLRAWGAPADLDLHGYLCQSLKHSRRGVVIGHEVYLFRFPLVVDGKFQMQILKYDICRHRLSVIDSPNLYDMGTDVQLMATEDGLLGLAGAVWNWSSSKLYLWSRTADATEGDAGAGWVRRRVIDLRAMSMRMRSFANNRISINYANDDNRSIIKQATVIGFAEGVNAILVGTNAGTFVIDLKSERARKICDTWIHNPVVPFMTFYSPDWACGKSPLPAETD